MTRHIPTFALLALAALILMGCQPSAPTADQTQAAQTEMQMQEAVRQVPQPAIVNFEERRLVAALYELRDQPNYRTYTYIVTLDGRLVKICDSVGYGVNASVQFSNPERVLRREFSDQPVTTIPQAEPNGLFMPEGLAATYVMCVDGDEVRAVYIEPEIIVSPMALTTD